MSVLLVDLDDTLLPDVAARDRALADRLTKSASAYVVDGALEVIRAGWRRCTARQLPSMSGVSSWEALWTDASQCELDPDDRWQVEHFQTSVWRQLLPQTPSDDAVIAFRESREALVTPFPWVRAWLADVASRHVLWCVTNGSASLQRRKLALAGLDVWFDDVVISGDVGDVKASARFASDVQDRLQSVGASAVGVVGDRDDSDGRLAAALAVPFCKVTTERAR